MANSFKLPISPEQLNGIQSVSRTEVFGTNYSVLGIGGFMEVYNISDLQFDVPSGTTGTISLSSNTIPINFIKGSGSSYSPDVLTLGADNISSGRRRLGMLVYVHETDQVYQYSIDNYDTLWNSATGATGVGGDTVVISDFGTTVKNNSIAGQNFINAWTASTIEGVSGSTRSTSVWKKYNGTNLALTGGTYDSFTGSLNLVNITGGTVTISGISGGGGGGGLTGGSFIYSAQTLELYSTGGTLSITGFSDVYVTGGTYSSGTITFTNNSGSTFTVTGLTTGGGGLGGGGTTNYVSKWTGSTDLGNSLIYDNGTSVSIGTASPNSSSILQTDSTNKGFLPPRMTEAQRNAILSPAIGLMVYQTDGTDGVYVYKAAGWIQMI